MNQAGELEERVLVLAPWGQDGELAAKVLEDHVTHCVAAALASGDPDVAGEKSGELLAAVQRFSRTR